MKIESLRELFVDELQDLYSAEKQIIKALPDMAEKCSSSELRTAFETHLEQSRQHQQRLDRIFDQIPKVDRDDKTCEGIQHKTLPAFSVQYHPEASPGPHDSRYLFQRFVDMMEKHKR